MTVVITSLITKNQLVIVLINIISLLIYVSVWFVINIKKFKFDFNIIKNFKYESINIVGEIFMLLIYLFGYRLAFGFGDEYYIALSFINLITDPIWDALQAQVKIAKIDISQSCYNYKKAIFRSWIVTLFYVGIALVLFFALFKVYNVILIIGLIYLVIQVLDILLYVVTSNLKIFLQLEYSPTKTTLIYLFMKMIRTVLTIFLFTPYNTDIAQISTGLIFVIILLILRYKNYKLDNNGTLIRKSKSL